MSIVWLIGFIVTLLVSFYFVGKYDLIDFSSSDGETIFGGLLSFMIFAAFWPVTLPLTGLGVFGYKLYCAGKRKNIQCYTYRD